MRKATFSIFCIFILQYTYAQDRSIREMQNTRTKAIKSLDSNGWKLRGTFIMNINQGTLSNWAAGGEQSVLGINSIFNYGINFKKDKHTWDNYFDMALGFQNATSFGKFRKIDDRIDITSKYGYFINRHWYLGLLANFNTQSLEGYDYSLKTENKVSNFLAPGKIVLSPGIDYKSTDVFSLFASPVSVRWVLKKDPDFYSLDKFGVDSGRTVSTELGAFVTGKVRVNITKWATYSSRIDLFSNYNNKPENIDVLMNNLLTMKFTKLFATNISLDMIYDDDVIKRLQLKEILGVGLTVRL